MGPSQSNRCTRRHHIPYPLCRIRVIGLGEYPFATPMIHNGARNSRICSPYFSNTRGIFICRNNSLRFMKHTALLISLIIVAGAFAGCLDSVLDDDGDGLQNADDNCPSVSNENQEDFDADGLGNECDEDDDGDGTLDEYDDYPFDSSEISDSDGDGVGDNADVFPNDATETVDSDSDAVGDNGDNCPIDINTNQVDQDGDGQGDTCDYDRDGDGVINEADFFPDDSSETTDTDSDGVGDNSDAFPDDASETTDTDSDGIGDNSDAFPDDASEFEDPDGDGLGSNLEQQIGTNPNSEDTDGDSLNDGAEVTMGTDPLNSDSDFDGLGDAVETNTGTWSSASDTGTDPLSNDSDGDGLTDGQESNTGETGWVVDASWISPSNVNEQYTPVDVFIEAELKVNVVLIGMDLESTERDGIASMVNQEHRPINMQNWWEYLGVEYDVDLSIINAPDQLDSDFSDFLNQNVTRNWTTGSFIDWYGNQYVDDAFDEAFGNGDYSDQIINGIDAQATESWLFLNAPNYDGLEDVNEGYVLYILEPDFVAGDTTDAWPYYYYLEAEDIDTGTEDSMNNLVSYGGNYPIYFIDLMTPPPSFGQGFGCVSGCADRANNPPSWLMQDDDERDEIIAEYIEESIQFHFAPSYVYTPEYESSYEMDMILIDATSDGSAAASATDYFNMATAQLALDFAVPYTDWTFEIVVVDIDDPVMDDYQNALEASTTTISSCYAGGQAQVIDSRVLIQEADELIIRPAGMVTIPVFVTIFDDCGWVDSEYTMGSATSYENGTPFGVFMATGMNQLVDGGLTGTVVHELGHMLGLAHPHHSFELNGTWEFEQDWFWGSCASTMTYYDGLENIYFDAFNYDALDRGHAVVILDDVQNLRYEIWTELEAKGYEPNTLTNEMIQSIQLMDDLWEMSLEEFSDRNYYDYYSGTGYDSVTLALLSREAAYEALEMATDLESYIPKIWVDFGTDPNDPDSDGDGLSDGVETMSGKWRGTEDTGTDPLSYDSDGDGLSDGSEVTGGLTDPTMSDTDNDGLSDGNEILVVGTDPNDPDSDGDGLKDGFETMTGFFISAEDAGTNPLDNDTDGDGLEDGFEVNVWGSDPNVVDTDGDGFYDADDYWPTFDLQIYINIRYYNVENTDFWSYDDVYFWINIDGSGWELTDTVTDNDEGYVEYNYSYNAADHWDWFFFVIEAWDSDDTSDDDQYDIDGRNSEDSVLYLVYYPDSGRVDGDAPHLYIRQFDNGGYTWVYVDGSDDGDYSVDAEIHLIVGWEVA